MEGSRRSVGVGGAANRVALTGALKSLTDPKYSYQRNNLMFVDNRALAQIDLFKTEPGCQETIFDIKPICSKVQSANIIL